MKQKHLYICCTLALLLVISGCSMNKNTWTTRTIQSVNTRFNVHFNGKVSYDDAIKAIHEANKDDYGLVIPMYPISNHENAAAGTSQLNRAIEKCRKAIKTRSIKIKPEYNRRKAGKKGYRAFTNQEEYNPFMDEVWLLLAKAEFHKADFLGAVGTFNYIARHFKENEELGMTCQLWVVRSYAEMGWIYEAEDMLSKLNQKNLKGDNVGLYASVYADLLLKKAQYREAIPFLEMALERENDKALKIRFSYLLAQLYQQTGNKQKAHDAYSNLIKKNPPYEMAFNATISKAGLFLDNMQNIRRELLKMTKNFNNRDYLDQLYYTIGKSYLHDKDTVKALNYFHEAVDNSTRNGIDKAVTLMLMGDLYYAKKAYVKAQPCYDEASKIITIDHPDYPRVFKRAEVLSELVVQHEMVVLQDSLQKLSAMSEADRLKNINAYIAKLEQEEKLAVEKEERTRQLQEENQERAGQVAAMPMIGGRNPQGEWYFYNPNLIRSGQTEFQSRWGRRKLEDNWRRVNKSAVLFGDEPTNGTVANDTLPNDLVPGYETGIFAEGGVQQQGEAIPDNKNPAYYLRQIPVTEEQLARSSQIWAEALFNMGMIYKDKLEDLPLSIETFREYMERFDGYELVPDALYQSYLMHTRLSQVAEAETAREKLINGFPDNRYAQLLANPNYIETKQQMFVEQDSIYRLAYEAFNKTDFETVFSQVQYVAEKYPMSTLMPKFLFLKALSIGKTKETEQFEQALTELLDAYPTSDVSSILKDMLALIKQGREAQQGTTHGTILARREVQVKVDNGDSITLAFSPDKQTMHRVMLISSEPEESLYALQFQLAIFNFSRFLLKDFELNISRIDATRNVLSVFDFDNYADAVWYLETISEEEEIVKLMKELKTFPMVISDHNYALTKSGFTLDDYLMYRSEMESEKKFDEENIKIE
ncbi:MAG: tetratricopeptide repeat protein [Paludibacter sp.]|nr:tetratricopeptide repeat protein [Paludibacter sp.]MDD4197987.1 tetratricopeptide repeat protein [Paludibacter sp.]MDD4427620.1 tetratricopeptide repeat protein [Paludibacter sp.]